MPAYVAQPLLDQAVDGRAEFLRQVQGVGDLEADRDPGLAGLGDQVLEILQAGLRGESGPVLTTQAVS